MEAYLRGLRETRDLGETEDDQDTVDLLTGIIEEFEKHGWFLRASLEG
jgi:starvation-inducible DNA-binding protein